MNARSLSECVDHLVSKSRQQKIWIMGVKEGMKKCNPTDFVLKFIPILLGEENLKSNLLQVYMPSHGPHRVHVRAVKTDGPPHQLIARIHHDLVKEHILRFSSQKLPLQYEGACNIIFPDLGPAVMKQQQQFDNIKCRWRAA